MYTVTIFDKTKKIFKTYHDITQIMYFDIVDDWVSVPESNFLTHAFPTNCSYQLLSNSGNYNIDSSIIGSFELEKEF